MNTETVKVTAVSSTEHHPKKNGYYFNFITRLYRFLVPAQSRVLHIGCKDGYLLHILSPSFGVGIDDNPVFIDQAKNRNPMYSFQVGMHTYQPPQEAFDYVIISSSYLHVDDVQEVFESIKRFCSPETRVIVEWHSYFWEPILMFARRLCLFHCDSFVNRFSYRHVQKFLQLAGFEVVSYNKGLLYPWYMPGIAWFFNTCLSLVPGVRSMGLMRWAVARLSSPEQTHKVEQGPSVSVIIPCRNECGNIESAVQRCPAMGSFTEIIFAEGNSADGTLDEMYRVQKAYPEKNISVVVQPGKGKADAVRAGFALAKGDILMILDGDLTVQPEDLPRFYQVLVKRQGDFVNGSRLVYGMEPGSMRFLNLIANHFFAKLLSFIIGQSITDALCGTKVLYKKDYQKIMKHRAYFGTMDPFGDFDLLFGAARLNCKIVDMPIHYKNRLYGTSQIRPFRDVFPLLKLCHRAWKKFYAP